MSLKIPEFYNDKITVAIKGIGKMILCYSIIFYINIQTILKVWNFFILGNNCDTVICTTDKKLMTFYNGLLIKSCCIDIEAKHLEPVIMYEPKIEIYFILHGDNKVVIVKEETSLKVYLFHLYNLFL